MDYFNLQSELTAHEDYSKECLQLVNIIILNPTQIVKFGGFLKIIAEKGSVFHKKIKKSLDEFNSEISKGSLYTTTLDYYNEFYKLADTYLSNINNSFINLEKDIIDKINLYINEVSKNNEKNYKSFSTLISTVQEEKKMIEKVKKNILRLQKTLLIKKQKLQKMKIIQK